MQQELENKPRIAIAIPCFNEAVTVAKVIRDFRAELPMAEIFVFNNNSKDKTEEEARNSGARVITEKKQGKGFVFQNILRTIEADILILVDGDDTYLAKDVHALLEPILKDEADMVVGNRLAFKGSGFSLAHRFGNAIFRWFLNGLFRSKYADILSGFRVMKKDFYKNVPILAKGFELETELTLQSLERDYCIKELPIHYHERPHGSHSKINEMKDGFRIILTIVSLLRDYRPMSFFGYIGLFLVLAGFIFGGIVVDEYYETGIIRRVPTAILSIALIIVGINSVISGLILSAVARRQKETEAVIKQVIAGSR